MQPDSSSYGTHRAISLISSSENATSSITTHCQQLQQEQPLPLTSDNLAMLQLTNQLHAKHQYVASYVKHQISILSLEAKLQYQRKKEIQALVPLETIAVEKETILCCCSSKETNFPYLESRAYNNKQRHNYSSNHHDDSPKTKKRLSWLSMKRYKQSSRHSHPRQDRHSLSQPTPVLSSASPPVIDNSHHLATILFSSLISSCTFNTSITSSSSFSFLNGLRDSAIRESDFSLGQFHTPLETRYHSQLSSASFSSSTSDTWWTRKGITSFLRKGHYHHHCKQEDFLAFRYPRMVDFHKLRDTALQLLLNAEQQSNPSVKPTTSRSSSLSSSSFP